MTKILIKSLVRDNQRWIPFFKSMVDSLETKFPDIQFSTWIFENDSIDHTKKLIRENFKNYYIQKFDHPIDSATRTRRLAKYRNTFKEKMVDILPAYDYVLLVDSNIFFSQSSLGRMLDTIQKPGISMVCPHACVQTSLPCRFFYDTFATITARGEKCSQFTNVVECEHHGPTHDRHCHHAMGNPPIYTHHDGRIIDFNSCFGGFVLIKREAYEQSSWSIKDSNDCEHWAFCEDVRKHGRIVMDKEANVIWTEFF